MEPYLIHDLERLTGIKAHTIRIWEKRYGIITPQRTTTNRRYYSDDQVRKLLNITTLLAQGHKISHIAALEEDKINEMVQVQAETGDTDAVCSTYISSLTHCMLTFDEHGFEHICAAAVTRMGLYQAVINVLYPFLKNTGVLWASGHAAPVQEHFAACIIRRKLLAAIDGLLPPVTKDHKFLLFLPPGEWHEIALMLADYIIRSRGCETVYLGQNVPYSQVQDVAAVVKPQYLFLLCISGRSAEQVAAEASELAANLPDVKVLVAGSKELLPAQESAAGNLTYLFDIDELQQFLQAA